MTSGTVLEARPKNRGLHQVKGVLEGKRWNVTHRTALAPGGLVTANPEEAPPAPAPAEEGDPGDEGLLTSDLGC